MFVPGKISARQLITYGLFFLCAYAAWARGGTYPPLQWPLLIGTLLLCFSPFLLERDRRLPFWNRVRKDPIFGVGLGLMVLILCQWGNSSYLPVLNEFGGAELDRTPSKWLPWSVDRGEAGEMLVWFSPAWICVLFIRNLLHRKHVVVLLYLLASNSALLAGLGVIQIAVGTEKVLGIWEQPNEVFFASFGYANHACAWFYLNAMLAAGLAHDAAQKQKPPVQFVVWTICFLLCIVATFLTLSRFGAFIALTALLIALVVFLKRTIGENKRFPAVNAYIVACIVALIGITLFLGAGGGSLAREVGAKALVGEKSIAGDIAGRIEQMPLAWEIIKDYPLFGSGGWGYRWLIKLYIPVDEWVFWEGAGKANVHCDPVQFLSEFGVVGSLCMAAIVVVLALGVVAERRSVLVYWVAGGLVAVFAHSLIDLPFRCPAILLAWCTLLAALPRLQRRHTSKDSA